MNLKRKLYYLLSPKARILARKIIYTPYDFWHKILRKPNNLLPPKGLQFIGSGDFEKTGQHYLNMMINLCNCKPSSSILDIGCGIGRIAIPLTSYLNEEGSYNGFDIVKEGIDWCTKNINHRFSNFTFLHIPLQNELYNLSTKVKSSLLTFPYISDHFDLVIATSVFTHMMPEDVENYFKEIHRVLRKEGKFLCTFFVLNQDSAAAMSQNPHFNFPYSHDYYALMDDKVKEANVAYSQIYLENLFHLNQLSITHYLEGYWSSGDNKLGKEFQDTFILTKH